MVAVQHVEPAPPREVVPPRVADQAAVEEQVLALRTLPAGAGAAVEVGAPHRLGAQHVPRVAARRAAGALGVGQHDVLAVLEAHQALALPRVVAVPAGQVGQTRRYPSDEMLSDQQTGPGQELRRQNRYEQIRTDQMRKDEIRAEQSRADEER